MFKDLKYEDSAWKELSFEELVKFVQGKNVVGGGEINAPLLNQWWVANDDDGYTFSFDDGSVVGMRSECETGYYGEVTRECPKFYLLSRK